MRANHVADLVLARVPAPSAMKLQKLVYYCQAWHLAITDEPLFLEPCRAYVDGPVVEDVRHARIDPHSRRPMYNKADMDGLNDTIESIVELVCRQYGGLSGDELSALTHEEDPWLEGRAGLTDNEPSRQPLRRQTMATFYRNHRLLGGRKAADLAATGVLVPASDMSIDLDFAALLRDSEIAEDDMPDYPPAFSANTAAYPDAAAYQGILRRRVARDDR